MTSVHQSYLKIGTNKFNLIKNQLNLIKFYELFYWVIKESV